ncbi:hypothetical protein QBC38DRAFT_474726 [Podospora fimiseda]|uniref:Trafficking protein particle complex subunit 12 n=1 Tax=Podospora fimiseda TaxID=252190 RepID=A0AAN7BS40_9PEZI|nr:hypothetical protein QBC38DRAFT_474726 [Podospora fimiseda]
MDASQSSGQKGHTRTRSAVKATRPRSSTKGPLDADEIPITPNVALNHPLAVPAPSPVSNPLSPNLAPQHPRMLPYGHGPPPRSPGPHPRTPGATSPLPRSPAHSPVPPNTPGALRRGPTRPKDFAYLLRPEIYHPLTPLNVPPAFRNNQAKQPSPDTPIPDLLARGQFRAAAIAATQALTGTGDPNVLPQPDPTDHVRIFDLLYTRLACLTLIDSTSLAAQEVKALGDLNSAFYFEETPSGNVVHLVPWELRVLNIRLSAVGFGDLRRAIMSFYELAREARGNLAEAMATHDNSARELWKERLGDLGVRVAGALVEMKDLEGAAEHLKGLRDGEKMGMSRALLWLHLGDVEAARGCVSGENTVAEKVVLALCDMADADYGSALRKWEGLREETDDEMVGVNMAVCLLYLGRMQEGRALLEELVSAGRASHTLLFNLTTMYELCTERSRGLKVKLTEKVAGMTEEERTNADFKL